MRLVQYTDGEGARRVAIVEDNDMLRRLSGTDSVYGLAHRAAAEQTTIGALAEEFASQTLDSYTQVCEEGRLRVPLDHPVDAARCVVSGTGLTHLGLGEARAALLERLTEDIDAHTDPALALIQAAVRGAGETSGDGGAQPEWFYKGDGDALVASGEPLVSPAFADDGGDEAEVAALFVIDGLGNPCRVGYALANEFTDHRMEHANALYMGHCKLRPVALGPELRLGPLPADVRGRARVLRSGTALWEAAFATGEDHWCHRLANLEHHHFKYAQFRRPGDVHVHMLGAATQSFAHGIETRDGDVFEIEADGFGAPLRNTLRIGESNSVRIKQL